MEPLKYIFGIKGIAHFFGLTVTEVAYLLKHGGIPGAFKLKRKGSASFNGGGRGVWVLHRRLADQYRYTRQKTPLYDPQTATDALLKKFEGTGCRNIPELIIQGIITDNDWCDTLDYHRSLSNMHIPIMMHPQNLKEYFEGGLDKGSRPVLYSSTKEIFKKVRNRG